MRGRDCRIYWRARCCAGGNSEKRRLRGFESQITLIKVSLITQIMDTQIRTLITQMYVVVGAVREPSHIGIFIRLNWNNQQLGGV